MNIYTKNDNKVLKNILSIGDRTKGLVRENGTSIKELVERTGLSDKKVRTTIKKMIEDEYIEYGTSDRNTKKYIVTLKGMEYMQKLEQSYLDELKEGEF